MLEFLKNEANRTFTENGAVTYRSSLSDCVDYFARIGGMRHESGEDINKIFARAYAEDPDIAMKLLFYTRDVRGGIGERRIFRTIIKELSSSHTESVRKNIEYIAEYGRYDDLFVLFGTPCEEDMLKYVKEQFKKDIESMESGKSITLLAKWMPSVNASNAETVKRGKKMVSALGLTEKEYRQTLSKLRAYNKIIENNLREKDYTFDYSKQPSKAMLKYRAAFIRNDGERYAAFLEDVSSGKKTINTKTLYPYEIVRPIINNKNMSDATKASLNATWEALEDFTNNENSIVVVDGSGSMYWRVNPAPIEVAISLGIYFAERNKGEFHNHFITFSSKPQLVEVKGSDIFDKVRYCMNYDDATNTNIQKVFELILNTAVKHKVSQSELPSTMFIVSDMEFDYCTNDASATNFEYARKLFEDAGYTLPQVVFWNVASRTEAVPVTKNEQGAILVSGASPRIFDMVKSRRYDPCTFMLDVINSERYSCITA